jgi:hypothetical protein
MKTITLITLFASMLFSAKAAILTVSNDPNQPAQFTTINDAMTAAGNNDTIYISGSNVIYPNLNITKSNLTFIGAGFNPQKQNPLSTMISGLIFSSGGIKENISFSGINFVSSVSLSVSGGILRKLNFTRCQIGLGFASSGSALYLLNCSQVVFHECIIKSHFENGFNSHAIQISNNLSLTNIIFQNNVIFGDAAGVNLIEFDHSTTVNTNNVVFTNNIFHNKTGAAINLVSIPPTSQHHLGFIFSNNIFDSVNPIHPLIRSASYFNNIINTSVDLNNPTSASSVGANNIINQNAQFVNLPLGASFLNTLDYSLLPSSPCIGTGLNGVDMGVKSGNGFFQSDGEPLIPQIDEFVIFNPVIPQGVPLQIRVKATSVD